MLKYRILVFFIFIPCFIFAQAKPEEKHHTIKISKPKFDSVYIKAEINFLEFQEGNKNSSSAKSIAVNAVTAPFPIISGYSVPFDYNRLFNKNIEIEKSDLENKITDTIRIQLKILDNGKAYYKDLTPLMVLNGVPAYYNKTMNAYKLDAIHWKCMNVLKHIKQWEPAYVVVGVKDTFKKTTVIKPKKTKLAATGVLIIVFSLLPFE
jgi:hypothetical protein